MGRGREYKACHMTLLLRQVLLLQMGGLQTGGSSTFSMTVACTHCKKEFYGRSRNQSLVRHMLIHTGEKPFACPHCPHRANMRHNLRTHILTVHNLYS